MNDVKLRATWEKLPVNAGANLNFLWYILAGCAIIATIFFIILYKRRKEDDEDEETAK